MKTFDGGLTISRIHSSDDDTMEVEIHDNKSGIRIVTLTVGLSEMMQALTGLARTKGITGRLYDSYEDVDKVKDIKEILIDGRFGKDEKEKLRNLIDEQLAILNENESVAWMINSDGLNSQQPISGKHRVVLYRYI